ncbi:hypothetical protein VB773_16975 [Haloarculaceae archaeon H-GB2-1]|nr:hypothetical protein [Haloarculaceae archaeon H-GB1-1]MEA5387609.1 hypothetical protein [Haloarculaceae archaeon H-GB11]MEA5409096.1 hypothetical protein [Haloarculaceae archaeon H-GB2-1]
MSPSRRTVLRAVTSTAALALTGCQGAGTGDSMDTDRNGSESATTSHNEGTTGREKRFVVWLDGPDERHLLFDGGDVRNVGAVKERSGRYSVPITLSDEATASVSETFRTDGVDEDREAFEIVVEFDGEETGRYDIAGSLAAEIAEGDWDGQFLLVVDDRDTAEKVRQALVTDSE